MILFLDTIVTLKFLVKYLALLPLAVSNEQLTQSEALHELFREQVKQAESMGLLDTSSITIDASKVDANEKSVPPKDIKDDGQSANWAASLILMSIK